MKGSEKVCAVIVLLPKITDCLIGTIYFQVTQIVYQKQTNIFIAYSSNTLKKLLSNCKPVWYTETMKCYFSAGASVPYKFCIKITLKMVPCNLLHFFKTEIKNSACKSLTCSTLHKSFSNQYSIVMQRKYF